MKNSKNDFIYKSIDDAIGTIRAMDMKSNVMIAFIGVMIFALIKIDANENVSKLMIFSILWGLGTVVVFIYAVVLPRLNPISELENVEDIINEDIDKRLFFPIEYRDFKKYFNNFNNTSDDNLLKLLSLERLKLQIFIDKKIGFFKIGLYWGFLPFLLLVFINLITKV
jgi:hypothetical protein